MKIDPVSNIIFRLPFVKNRLKNKFGIDDVWEYQTGYYRNKEYGLSITFAGIIIFILPFNIGFSIMFIVIAIVGIPKTFPPVFFFLILLLISVLSSLLCYFHVDKKNKYLLYFKEFEKKTRKWQTRWAIISLFAMIIPFLMLVFSFWLLSKK
jgi:uncharacterized membrane protein